MYILTKHSSSAKIENMAYTLIAEHLQSPPGPNCGITNTGDYRHASVLVPFLQLDNEWHILFEKRAENIRQGGEVSFPGGGVEVRDKDSRIAAVRETEEELGIPASKIEAPGLFGRFIGAMDMLIDTYIGMLRIGSLTEISLNPGEVDSVFTLPFSYFLETSPAEYAVITRTYSKIEKPDGSAEVLFPAAELGLPERYHSSWQGKPTTVYVYPNKPHTIWGITAKILVYLCRWYRTLPEIGNS